ncbi:diguanylate cyclase [Psychromonas sp. B3M02]|uniref:sensor domain-containing diguanylate cyclase n=1 Tax=Psychromonas sp. B3M02 TaxID=2267226 RepID=UPI000DEAE59F|nr:diguanylate cyclase [Psychromonas sp. B3M02]RBW46928.1 diguanylate cyclase [Psychromonas sp. B3M02]
MTTQFAYTHNIIDCLDTGVFVVDKHFTVQLWNKFMEVHSNFTESKIIGKNFFECFSELPKKWFERKIHSVFMLNHESYTSWEQRPYLLQFSHGRSVTGQLDFMYQNCNFAPICDQNNEVQYVCVTIKDMTDIAISTMQLKEACAELERVSSIDGLTHLYNRSHWEKAFTNEVERIERYGGEVSLIIFDMDYFKKINDQNGHLFGDQVLREVAQRCKEVLRSADVIGRYGGEEFVIFLPETNVQEAALVAEKLRKKIAEFPVSYEGVTLPVSISAGFTASNTDNHDFEKLLHQADIALYQAKQAGRNQCIGYTD